MDVVVASRTIGSVIKRVVLPTRECMDWPNAQAFCCKKYGGKLWEPKDAAEKASVWAQMQSTVSDSWLQIMQTYLLLFYPKACLIKCRPLGQHCKISLSRLVNSLQPAGCGLEPTIGTLCMAALIIWPPLAPLHPSSPLTETIAAPRTVSPSVAT